MQTSTPLNDSLNAPKTRWGLSLPVILLVFLVAACFAWEGSFPNGEIRGLLVAVGIPALSKGLASFDPQIYRLAVLSLSFKSRYDPGR
jgi:hypothetical protein